jgi:Helix-turn-helix domain
MRRRQLPPHLALDPLLSENEVCSWVGFSLRTLQRKRKDGSIVGIPWSANRYRFRKSEIERFIAATEKETVVRFGGDKHESASSADLTKIPGQIAPNLTAALSREEPQAKQRRARGSRKTQVAQ